MPGDTTIDRFAELTGLTLEEGPYETVAGFVVARLGRLAEQGDAVAVDGATLTVATVRRRRITVVRLDRASSTAEDAEHAKGPAAGES